MPFCSKCGTEVPENVSFCQECGNALQSGQTNQANKAAPAANAGVENLSLWGYFIKCLKNYANFKGRARRKEFSGFVLFWALIWIGLYFGYSVFGDMSEYEDDLSAIVAGLLALLHTLYELATLIPFFAVCTRRVHDLGKSVWHALPIVAILVSISILFGFYIDDFNDLITAISSLRRPAKAVTLIVTGFIYILWLSCSEGEAKKNEYGSSPKQRKGVQK